MNSNMADQYRKMLAYLESLGADLVPHNSARLAIVKSSTLDDMNQVDLLHYQRVLEATIDNHNDLMDKEAMREELVEVVRERFMQGAVADKNAEAKEFRSRLATL